MQILETQRLTRPWLTFLGHPTHVVAIWLSKFISNVYVYIDVLKT